MLNIIDLHDACRSGDLEMVEKCIAEGKIYLDAIFCDWTPLFTACFYNRVPVVRALAQCPSVNISINVFVFYNWTPLHVACSQGHAEVVEELLRYKIDINERDSRGRTPFYLACAKNSVNIARQLIYEKANTETPDLLGKTPFVAACEEGHVDVMRELLSRSVPADVLKAFVLAQNNDRVEIVRELLPLISRNKVAFCLVRKNSPQIDTLLLDRMQNEYWNIVKWLIYGQKQSLCVFFGTETPLLQKVSKTIKEKIFL